jgi:hypothetical protein
MRFVHIYAMRDQPDRLRVIAPRHAAYWHGLGLPGYLGGPFEDRSGGVVSFEAESADEAIKFIGADPFVQEDLLESSSVKEWLTDQGGGD